MRDRLDWSAIFSGYAFHARLLKDIVSAAEYDGLLPQDTELAQKINVPDVFGATTEDTDGLRIVSLHEVSRVSNTTGTFGIAYAGMLHERIVFTHMHAAVCGKVQCSSVRVTHKRTKITLTIMHVLCVMQHQYIMVAAVCTALHNVTLPKVGAACMLAFSAVMLESSEQAWSCRLIWTSWRGSLTLKTQKKKTSPSDSQHCLRFASTCAMHPADFHLLTRCVTLSSQHWLRH